MRGKSLLIIILTFVICLSGCNIIENKELKKDKDGFPIGTSNKENESIFQVKVIIDKINIREDSKVSSNKVGVVEKNTILDVLDYTVDKKYIWFKIKTGNNLNGYIASEIESPYVSMNRDIDVLPPELTIHEKTISVESRAKLEDAIKNNISYKDDKDLQPTFNYKVNYEKEVSKFVYNVEIMVIDSSNNEIKDEFRVKITNEKQVGNNRWITYKEMVNKQQQAKSLCSSYGLTAWKDAIGCISNDGKHDISIANYTGTTRIGFYEPFEFCNYDEDLKAVYCEDGKGNNISHDLISNKLKNLENSWLPKFKKYMNAVKDKTGYDLYELTW